MNKLIPIEHKDQRVLLTNQLAEGYGTTTDVITKNFSRNKERYQEGKHYFEVIGDALRDFKANGQIDLLPNTNRLYLWTEKGALLHAKSLGTDEAWETYDRLVETYFKAKEAQFQFESLSPELRLLISIETQQKQQQAAIEATNQRLDDIQDVITLDHNEWREDSRKLIAKMAQKLGGNEYIQDLQSEIYKLVEQRAGAKLSVRLTNSRRRMAEEGVCKSKRDKRNRVDEIGEDKKLKEIYVAIVKEMAIKYGVATKPAA